MSDLISRQEAINAAERESQVDGAYGYMDTKSIVDMLNNLPSAQPERKKGKWNPHPFEKEWDVCSSCGTGCKRREREFDHLGQKSVTEYSYQYCPWCGAKMDGERRTDEAD